MYLSYCNRGFIPHKCYNKNNIALGASSGLIRPNTLTSFPNPLLIFADVGPTILLSGRVVSGGACSCTGGYIVNKCMI